MKAVVHDRYGPPDVLRLEEVERPVPMDDEVLVNRWLAEDLQARVGDTLRLSYFVVGPMRRLEQQSRVFRIRAVLPLEGAAADSALMPANSFLTASR